MEIGRLAHPEGDLPTGAAGEPAPQVRVAVIGIDHRRPVAAQRLEELALRPGDSVETAEPFQVRGARVDDETDAGCGDPGEVRDLARVIRAHLDHGIAMRGLEPREGERHTDVVVEVAAGNQAASPVSEDRPRHLLDRGLAVAAGDAHDGARKIPPPCACERSQAREHLGHDHLRDVNRHETVDQRTRGAARCNIGDEIVRVVMLAAQGDEQVPLTERARIARDPAKGRIGAVQRASGHGRERGEIAHHEAAPNASSTTARSLNGRRSWPVIW